MDKPINPDLIRQRRWRSRLILMAIVALLVAGWWLLHGNLAPSIEASRLRLATVESGPVSARIDAVGTLEPGIEQSLTSPLESIVTEVRVLPGESVVAGQLLLRLDDREQQRQVTELGNTLELKRNEQQVSELALQITLDELNASLELKQLDLEYRIARHQRLATLASNGGVSKDQLLEASLDVKRSRVEISQLEKSLRNQQHSNQATLTRIALEASILEGQLEQARRVLAETEVRAPEDGYLAFVLEQVGQSVSRGTELARLSDPQSFRIKAQLSDFYANSISPGMLAQISDQDQTWPGRLSRIVPDASSGTLTLLVDFDDRQISGLMMQQRVDVALLLEERPDGLRVARGPGIGKPGPQQLFVINGEQAERREVVVGISNREFVSIVSGLSPGETLITMDMSPYLHLDQIRIDQE